MEKETVIKELSEQEELALEKNLVWIFGSPRIMVNFSKMKSNKINVMNEPKMGLHLNSLEWKGDEVTTFVTDNQRKRTGNARYDYFFYQGYKEIWNFYLRKLILNRIYSQFNDLDKKIMILESWGNMGLNLLIDCLPDSKVLILVQDGRTEILSRVQNFIENKNSAWMGVKQITYEDRKQTIQYFAKQWAAIAKNLLSVLKIPPMENRQLIKVENLIENKNDVLNNVFKFLELKNDEAILNSLNKMNDKISKKKIKIQFNQEEKTLLNTIIKNELNGFGYE